VPVGQQETGRAVIKKSRSPSGNRVTRRASRSRDREPSRNVIRHIPAQRCGALEGRLVAAITIGRMERVVVAHMAGGAGSGRWRHVRSG
jgi:hypothetical protein